MSLSRVFLTGASGFIGRNVLAAALADSRLAAVRWSCLARGPAPVPAPADPRVTQVVGDLREPTRFAAALAGHDAVVHLAALTGKARASALQRVNTGGTRTLLEACRAAKVERFLFVSTIAAGYPELDAYPYARSKLAAEVLVAASGLRHTILRPTIVVGQGAPVWPVLRKLAGERRILMFGDGRVLVQPVSVGDVARAVVEVLAADRFDGVTRELGGPQVLSFLELVQAARRVLGKGETDAVRRLPLRMMMPVLRALEPLLLPLLPVTAGQLYAFRHDSTARPDEFLERAVRERVPVAAMLAQCVGHG